MTEATPKTAAAELQDLPTRAADLIVYMKDIGIDFTLHEHVPVFTVAESEKIELDIPGTHCRNLFLRDKKKKMFLVVAANETKIDLKKLQELIGSDRLSFGSADRLWENLGVRPGSVCPFAIINDKDKNVQIVLDQDMMASDIVNYHPMENHLTVGLSPQDLLKFIRSCGHKEIVLDMKPAAPDE